MLEVAVDPSNPKFSTQFRMLELGHPLKSVLRAMKRGGKFTIIDRKCLEAYVEGQKQKVCVFVCDSCIIS